MRAAVDAGGFSMRLLYRHPGTGAAAREAHAARVYAANDTFFQGAGVSAAEAAANAVEAQQAGQRVAFDVGLVPDGQLSLMLLVVAPSGCLAAQHDVTLTVRRDTGMQVRTAAMASRVPRATPAPPLPGAQDRPLLNPCQINTKSKHQDASRFEEEMRSLKRSGPAMRRKQKKRRRKRRRALRQTESHNILGRKERKRGEHVGAPRRE